MSQRRRAGGRRSTVAGYRRKSGLAVLAVGGIIVPTDRSPILIQGILKPAINSLLSRVRHTNTLVIADRGFPFWPQIETVDISLVDGVPTVLEVLTAIRGNFKIGQAIMAREFIAENSRRTRAQFARALKGIPTEFEPHAELKQRVPGAIGLIRTGDTVQYANLLLVSA